MISLAGVVFSRSVRVAGDKMDEAITEHIKRKYNVLIGERTAELIKITLGSAYPDNEIKTMEIKGRDLHRHVRDDYQCRHDEDAAAEAGNRSHKARAE